MDKTSAIIGTFIFRGFPRISTEMRRWERLARGIPDAELRKQALSSLRKKRFHSQGGSVFATYSTDRLGDLTKCIIALQTISDYLDNLCDRTVYRNADGFRRLHAAIVDAVSPDDCNEDYYSLYPLKRDGGYLRSLVDHCRSVSRTLPGFKDISPAATRLLSLYTDLQVYKHLNEAEREKRVVEWISSDLREYAEMEWWELACATGSTLGVFALLAIASVGPVSEETAAAVVSAYFPTICGLHILLDYLIDMAEDAQEGDMNFVSYYSDRQTAACRLTGLVRDSLALAGTLPRPGFHRTVILGLLAMYLSDPKVDLQNMRPIADRLLDEAGSEAWRLYRMCRGLRALRLV